MSYGIDKYGEYIWDRAEIKHTYRVPSTGDMTHFLPDEMRMKLFANRVVSNIQFTQEALDWCDHNCSAPYFVQDNDTTIMFVEESDRTMFLLKFN